MKTLALLLASAFTSFAQPFLVCDKVTWDTNQMLIVPLYYEIYMDGTTNYSPVVWVETNVYWMHYDLSKISNGWHTVTVTLAGRDDLWGTNRSLPSDPFTFWRPDPLPKPERYKVAR